MGKVVDIGNKLVTISAFLKADGYIPVSQFKDEAGRMEIQVGSEVEVVIDYLEDLCGDIKLSREKAKRIREWQRLEEIYKSNKITEGFVTAKVKGGFTVKLGAVKAFLPGSLFYVDSSNEIKDIKGKRMNFKIIKLEKKKNNVVVSQKFLLEEKNSKSLKSLLKKISKGKVLDGIIKNITDYGVFIDLGGLDGLLHITDMSWRRVKHPGDMVKIGNKIKVKILKFDKETNRVSLGLKQLTQDPWVNIKKKYQENMFVNGKVTNITDYGCFVEIEEGIEGLVHLSEMDWSNKNINPNNIVKSGMTIKVSILSINVSKRRISLGLKQCIDNPWMLFSKKYKKNDSLFGRVKIIADFGLFLDLDYGVDGLLHSKDIFWKNSRNSNFKKFKKGERIKVVILKINIDRERVFLSMKRLIKN